MNEDIRLGKAILIVVLLIVFVGGMMGLEAIDRGLGQQSAIASVYSTDAIYRPLGNSAVMGTVLLDDATATCPGDWTDVRKYVHKSVHVSGITTATVQIYGSNTPVEPLNTTDHVQLGANITADSIREITYPVKWIKVKVSAHTTGTIDAYLLATTY